MTNDREEYVGEFRLLEWINVILNHTVLIVVLMMAPAVAAYALCKSMKPLYVAEAKFIASRETETRSFSRIVVPQLGQAPEQYFNIFATSYLSGYYMELLRSDAVLRPIIERRWESNGLTLAEMFKLKNKPTATVERQAMVALRRRIVRLDQDRITGMVTVRCTTTDPDVSADLANALVAGLQDFLARHRKKNVDQLVSVAEESTSQAKTRLNLANKDLEDFWRRNRDASVPELKMREQQLQLVADTHKETFLKLKGVGDVLALTKQQEEETINIVQPAERPWSKSWPRTRYTVAGAAFFGFILALVIVFVRHGIAALSARGDNGYQEFARHVRRLNWLLPGLILFLPRNDRTRTARQTAPAENEALAGESDGS